MQAPPATMQSQRVMQTSSWHLKMALLAAAQQALSCAA